jgi:hypothetical protein
VSGRRAVFLDIDGTYAHHGVVPAAHEAAVRRARERGHLVLLCTGRPRSMVPPRLTAAGFDGFVGSAGGYVTVGDRVLADRRFPGPLAARAVRVLDEHRVAYILEAPDVLFGRPGIGRRLAALLDGRMGGGAADHEGPRDILDALRTPDDLADASFGKVTFFDSPVPAGVLAAEVGEGVSALPASIPGMGDTAGELYLTGVTKALGLRLVADHLGLARDDLVGIGDGLNDVEMLEYAGTSVAVEGSDPRLLAAADLVVPGPERDGLVTAFGELGLL